MADDPHSPTALADPRQARALSELIAEQRLCMAFQPIVDLRSAEVVGHEALTRFDPTDDFPDTGALYDAAARLAMLSELEAAARHRAFEAAARWHDGGLLFMNNSPAILAEDGYLDQLDAALDAASSLAPTQVVLEITERCEFLEIERLRQRTAVLRARGFQIALDDVGSGISGLNRIMALRPEWVKLDRQLIAGVDEEPMQQNLLRALVHFARLSNIKVIAEGIERSGELALLAEIGVGYGQGFLLGRPALQRQDIDESVRRDILALHERSAARRYEDPATVRAGALASPVRTFDCTTPASTVLRTLQQTAGTDCAVILDGRRFHGVVRRDDLPEGACGAPVGELIDPGGTLIGPDMTLTEALELAASRPARHLAEPLVILQEGQIKGLLPLRDLLEGAAERSRHLPSHLASLTGLPGRVQADRWLADRIRAGDPCNLAFIDLRDFDAYNVAYGFHLGDAMLMRLVGLVRAHMPAGTGEHFLAHLGEDRFMVAFHGDRTAELRRLAAEFALVRAEFFSGTELHTGAFHATDARGTDRTCPLTSVRVVYLEHPLQRVSEPREVIDLARQLRLAESGQDPIAFDRRTPPIARKRIA